MRSINLGRWSRRVERYFNMKGGGGLMDVETSIRAILPIFTGVEDIYLEGWNRFSGAASVAANAANNGAVRLRNPTGSNAVIVIEQLLVSNAVATNSFFNVQQGLTNVDLTTTSTGFRNDARYTANSVGVISSQNVTPANLGSGNAMLSVGANILGRDLIVYHDTQFTLLPGDAIQIVDNTQNEQVVVNFRWRERSLEASELTG